MSRSKRKHKKECCCCCEPCCCEQPSYGNQGVFNGVDSCVVPIIFLLIACGSGLLNSSCSFLIILLFLLVGGSFGNMFGGEACC